MSGVLRLTNVNFKGVPNQKAVRINKKRLQKDLKDVRVAELYRNDVLDACADLKDTTYKLYMYFAVNQDGYIGGLSKVDAINRTKISESSYKRAIKELQEKGYFVYTGEQVVDSQGVKLPLYDFFARPLVQFDPTKKID